MKLKRIDAGGRGFRLAPLTLEQVEDILDTEQPARDRAWAPILQSLANAGESVSRDELEALLDLEEFRALQGAVLDLSALLRHKNQPAPPRDKNDEPFDFSYVRARCAAHCGWTFSETNRSPFPDVIRLLEYWAEVPPVDATFAAFVSYKPPAKSTRLEGEDDGADKAALVHQWGGRIIQGRDNLPAFLQASMQAEGLLDFSKPSTPPN